MASREVSAEAAFQNLHRQLVPFLSTRRKECEIVASGHALDYIKSDCTKPESLKSAKGWLQRADILQAIGAALLSDPMLNDEDKTKLQQQIDGATEH